MVKMERAMQPAFNAYSVATGKNVTSRGRLSRLPGNSGVGRARPKQDHFSTQLTETATLAVIGCHGKRYALWGLSDLASLAERQILDLYAATCRLF